MSPHDPSIGDQNIERLLATAYQPEQPDADFAKRVQAEMLAAARLQAKPPRSLSVRGRLVLAWSAVAAGLLLGVGLLAPRLTRQSVDIRHEGAGVWIDGKFYVRADGGGPPKSVPQGAGPEQPRIGNNGSRITARPKPPTPDAKAVAIGATLETGADERRRVSLPDGSVAYLNQHSTVEVVAERRLRVRSGEVFLEVVHRDGNEPASRFVVETPDREVVALGTKFAVRAEQGGTEVSVAQGQVQVSGMENPLEAGQEIGTDNRVVAAPRATHRLAWTRELMASAETTLVPPSPHRGGGLVIRDPSNGQEGLLSLRKYHIDVHIEDGFARTTIDQTYFNHEPRRLEGTFYFPLPPDASLARLAMYVEGKLMEGGMLEHDRAKQIYEGIVAKQRDPALLEWIDGSTFKMRVFPLEARQEKRIVLSYTQPLDMVYGKAQYRFPTGHSLEEVRDWSFHARVKHWTSWPQDTAFWTCESHTLKPTIDGRDLLLDGQARNVKLHKDLALSLSFAGRVAGDASSFAVATHEDHRYVMVRYRPELPVNPLRRRRDWVILCETAGDRNPLLARTQIEIIRGLLANAERGDTFAVLTAGTRATAFAKEPLPVTPENVKQAVEFLERTHLIGALDLDKAMQAAVPFLQAGKNPHLVHVGAGMPALGERRTDRLVARLPQGTRYVGIGVGRRWSRALMKAASDRTAGHFTQINPDEPINWRVFDLVAGLNTPRLQDIKIVDDLEQASWLPLSTAVAHGEELVAIARGDAKFGDPPMAVTITGTVDGKPFRKSLLVKNTRAKADFLPRSWAKLEIERLLADDANGHRDEIVALSKAMYVMTPFTSLLVLENEKMYAEFNVDRGRKDHWAMYPCPNEIPVVHEPLPGDGIRRPVDGVAAKSSISDVLRTIVVRIPPRPVTWANRRDSFAGRVSMNVYDLLVTVYAMPFGGAEMAELYDLDYYDPAFALVAGGSSRIHPRQGSMGFAGGGFGGGGLGGLGGGGLGGFGGGGLGGFGGGGRGGLGGGGLGGFGGGGLGGFGGGGLGGLGGGGFGGGLGGGFNGFQGWGFQGFQAYRPSLPAPQKKPPKKPSADSLSQKPLGSEWLADEARRQGLKWQPVLSDIPIQRLAATGLLHRAFTREAPWLAPDPVLSNEAASADQIAWRLMTQAGPRSLIYQTPILSNDWRVFGDLLSYAPGLNTTSADIQAVVEAEAMPDPRNAAGQADPAAVELIERARSFGWMEATVPGVDGHPPYKVVFDGKGRYRYERLVTAGLQEIVVCDGKTLTHLYPEIGLGARRAVSRFHRAEFLALVPWALPPADDLLRGADLKCIDARTVLVQRRDGDVFQLHFSPDERLAETHAVEPKTREMLAREVYAASGAVRLSIGAGELRTIRTSDVKASTPPDLNPDTTELVVLNMPWRSAEWARNAGPNETREDWSDLHSWAPEPFLARIRSPYFEKNDHRRGLMTLMAAAGVRGKPWLEIVTKHAGDPLAEYFWALVGSRNAATRPSEPVRIGLLSGTDNLFIRRMQTIHDLHARLSSNELNRLNPEQPSILRREALDFVRGSPPSDLTLALLVRLSALRADPAEHRALADAFHRFATVPEWDYAARYERARHLFLGGEKQKARMEFMKLYGDSLGTLGLPPVDNDFRKCFAETAGDGQPGWKEFVQRTAAELKKRGQHVAIVGLAWQCLELGDWSLGQSVLEKHLAGLSGTEGLTARLAQIEALTGAYDPDRQLGDWGRAEKMLEELLADPQHARQAILWRLAAHLAAPHKLARVVRCTETALDIEYAETPALLSFAVVDAEHEGLMTAYEQMLAAAQTLDSPLPADLRDRIVRTAERWRRLSPVSGSHCCYRAGLLLSRLGALDLAWEFLLTSLAANPDEYLTWEALQYGGLDPELQLRLGRVLLELKPEDVQRLYGHAQLLHGLGRKDEARPLFRRVVDGDWPNVDNLDYLKQNARWYLEAR